MIPKGAAEKIRARGLGPFLADVARLVPFLGDRVSEIGSWDDVPLLSVRVDRLSHWYRPGLLVIGDGAHAMSPVGGVGINLAIQDAVAAGQRPGDAAPGRKPHPPPPSESPATPHVPTRVTQRLQVLIQDRLFRPALRGATRPGLPLALRLAARFPVLRRIPGWLIGNGVRGASTSRRRPCPECL